MSESKRNVDEMDVDTNKVKDEYQESDVLAKKRKVYDELSEEGPLTQEDVKYFKKEAIWRQMKYYKQKYMMVEKSLSGYEAKLQANQERMNIFDIWYEQVVKLVADKFNEDKLVGEPVDSSVMEAKKAQLVRILDKIIQQGIQVNDEDIKQQINDINEEVITVKQENSQLVQKRNELEAKLEEITNKYFKENERKVSSTLERINNHIKKEDRDNSGDQNDSSNNNGTQENTTPEQNGSSKINGQELDEITEEIKMLQKTNNEIESKFKSFIKEKEDALKQLNNKYFEKINEESKSHETEDQVKLENERIKQELEQARNNNHQLINTLHDNEKKLSNINDIVSKDIIKENEQIKEQLKKNETDLVRIRNIRDDLLGKQQIYEKSKTNEELIKFNKELIKKIENNEKTNDDNEIIKDLEQSYKQLIQDIEIKLLNKVDQENLIKKYQIEKTKADQKYFQIMRLKDSLTQENKILKLQNGKSNEIIEKNSEIEKSINEKVHQLSNLNHELKTVIKDLNQEIKDLNKSNQILKFEKGKVSNDFKNLVNENNKLITIENNLKDESKAKEMEIIKLSNKLSKYEKTKTPSTASSSSNSDELDGFRSMVKCSVCSKNWKNTVLTVCGHVFCNQCTKERLNARLRRCPSCNKGFSANDLLSIHL